MSVTDPARCTNCRQLQARVDALESELADLKLVVAQLGQQLAAARKDSSTSSKPPSSDIVKPPKSPPEGQDRRRIGGQPGHPKHERAAFPPEALNAGSFDHRPHARPRRGHAPRPPPTLVPRGGPQGDVREGPPSIPEHPRHPGGGPPRPQKHHAPPPPGVA